MALRFRRRAISIYGAGGRYVASNCASRGAALAAGVVSSVELILDNLPAQRVAVNAQKLRRPRLIALNAIQHSLDEAFFEFADGLIEQNAALHHLAHEAFQLVLHVCTLQRMRSQSQGPWCITG